MARTKTTAKKVQTAAQKAAAAKRRKAAAAKKKAMECPKPAKKKAAVKGKRAAPKKVHGLHETSVARLLKKGSAIGGADRATKDAVVAAREATEECLHMLGKSCQERLTLAKRKTITKDDLVQCLRSECHLDLAKSAEDSSSERRKGSKAVRRDIAVASALRVFSKGHNLRTTEGAKVALSDVAAECVVQLGQHAAGYAAAGKRVTIKESDVKSAAQCLRK